MKRTIKSLLLLAIMLSPLTSSAIVTLAPPGQKWTVTSVSWAPSSPAGAIGSYGVATTSSSLTITLSKYRFSWYAVSWTVDIDKRYVSACPDEPQYQDSLTEGYWIRNSYAGAYGVQLEPTTKFSETFTYKAWTKSSPRPVVSAVTINAI